MRGDGFTFKQHIIGEPEFSCSSLMVVQIRMNEGANKALKKKNTWSGFMQK